MTKNILILPGDGIGQEVSSSMKEVLHYLIEEQSLDFKITERNVGGSSYDEFGTPLTEETLKIAKDSDAILFGAVGGPQWDNLEWDNRPEQALLALRKSLSLFANLRPAFLFNELASASPLKNNIIENLDILIVRELTGGIYFGEPRGIVENESPKYGFNTMIYNEDEIRRIAKVAFEAAMNRNRKLCSVEKANVLEVSKFWRSIVTEMGSEYPEVELSHQLADNTAMQLVLNPNQYDVIVSGNLFGDILSDIAATLSGSIGMLPSASLNSSSQGMYEPCHGSAPDIAGKGVANPIAMIASLAMAFEYSLDRIDIAKRIESAIKIFISNGFRTKDISTSDEFVRTQDVAPALINILKDGHE